MTSVTDNKKRTATNSRHSRGPRLWRDPRRSKLAPLAATSGQSLIEVLVGLVIGGVLIVAAIFAISAMLRTNQTIQKSQAAAGLNQELLNRLTSFAAADWQNVATLPVGSSTEYFLGASGSASFAITGREGVLDNDVTAGLVGEWKFDEATGTAVIDMSGYRNDGAFVGGTSRSTGCVAGGCVVMNGTDAYVHRANLTWDLRNEFTVTAWVKAASFAPQMYIVEVLAGKPLLYVNGNALMLTLRAQDDLSWLNYPAPTQDLINGQWNFIAATYTASDTVTLYHNGRQIFSGTHPGFIGGFPAASTFDVGGRAGVWFNGSIDDVRVYNRALSAGEVKQIAGSNVFTRFFSLENACRTTDASGTIAGAAPCSGGAARDPSTLLVSVATQWQAQAKNGEVRSGEVLVRSRNSVLWQTDWSGISAAGPVTEAGNGFASSSAVGVTGGGSLRVIGF